LASDKPLSYYPVPVNECSTKPVGSSIPVKAVNELSPDYLVFLDSFGDNGILKDRTFLSNYVLKGFYPATVWGGQGVMVYEKGRILPKNRVRHGATVQYVDEETLRKQIQSKSNPSNPPDAKTNLPETK